MARGSALDVSFASGGPGKAASEGEDSAGHAATEEVQRLQFANEVLQQQYALLAERHAAMRRAAQDSGLARQPGAGMGLLGVDGLGHSEDIVRWDEALPQLLRTDNTLDNVNVRLQEVHFEAGPLGILFRPAPPDTGYALEIQEFVQLASDGFTPAYHSDEYGDGTDRTLRALLPSGVASPASQGSPPGAASQQGSKHSGGGAGGPQRQQLPHNLQQLQLLEKGMVLTHIEGKDLLGTRAAAASDMLAAAARPVTLRFATFPLSTLRRAHESLQSRFSTLQVRIEVLEATLQERENMFQQELHRRQAQLKVLASALRMAQRKLQGMQHALRCERSAHLELQAEHDELQAAHSQRMSSMMSMKAAGASSRSPDLLRSNSSRRGSGMWRAPRRSSAGRLQELLGEGGESFDGTPRPSDLTAGMVEGMSLFDMDAEALRLGGGDVGDSLALLKARLTQLACQRDEARVEAAQLREQVQLQAREMEGLKQELEEANAKQREDLVESRALGLFLLAEQLDQKLRTLPDSGSAAGAETSQALRSVVHLALTQCVPAAKGMSLEVATRALWEEYAVLKKQLQGMAVRFKKKVDGERTAIARGDALARKVAALQAQLQRGQHAGAPVVGLPPPPPKRAAFQRAPAASVGSRSPHKRRSIRAVVDGIKLVTGAASPRKGGGPASPVAEEGSGSPGALPSDTAAQHEGSQTKADTGDSGSPGGATDTGGAQAESSSPAPQTPPSSGASAEPADEPGFEKVVSLANACLSRSSSVIMESCMFKRSRAGKGRWNRWLKRYVKVQGGTLGYYKAEGDVRAKNSVPLSTMISARLASAQDSGRRANVFEVQLKGSKCLQFSAEDAPTASLWVAVLDRIAGQFLVAATAQVQASSLAGAAVPAEPDSDDDI